MKKAVLVTGDVVVDHHIYEGQRYTASATERQGVKVVREHGGAIAVTNLIQALMARAKDAGVKGVPEWTVRCPLKLPPPDETPCRHHALAVWKPFPLDPRDPSGKKKVWRADLLMGYGHDVITDEGDGSPDPVNMPPLVSPPPAAPEILVLDDGGFRLRLGANASRWMLPSRRARKPEWIVLKMSGPVCQGDLWHHLMNGYASRLIVVVSANDLRQEAIRLGAGLSWERTVEELHDALSANPVLHELATASRHLIVTFSADGALWIDNSGGNARTTLLYDAGGAEGAWARPYKGKAFGYLSCMVAAAAWSVMRNPDQEPELAPAIRAGLAGMRNLLQFGHGLVPDQPLATPAELPSGYPSRRLADAILRGGSEFAETPVPWTAAEWRTYVTGSRAAAASRPWQIVEMSQGPFGSARPPALLGLAAQTVIHGEPAIQRLPHARFGWLLTADRFEIEGLRSIERLMVEYREMEKAKRPLSIGVFGPPGAGKSFGVHQLADSIFGNAAWREFNLSQFRDEGDLIGALHQVRDAVLSGVTPVAFWDEFDSREYRWLQSLLAPMQDGRFQEGQISHAVGKCVFVFAGATSHSFAEFGPRKPGDSGFDDEAWKDFTLKKGPDFHSRLDAFLDVLGPNQRTLPGTNRTGIPTRAPDNTDVCTALRRAILIRALLGVPRTARLDIDADLLLALLSVPEYRHGARSIEKLVQALRPASDSATVRRSSLPPPPQLAMHLDPETFGELLERNLSFRQAEVIEALAPAIHETWRALARKEGWKMQSHLDRPFAKLAPSDQEDNRAAARRIPSILALAGLEIEKGGPPAKAQQVTIRRQLEHHLERLAEAEHDGWMDHRLRNGWRHATKRDDKRKLHPALVPYAELRDEDKGKDRNSVRHFPGMVRLAGYRITWM